MLATPTHFDAVSALVPEMTLNCWIDLASASNCPTADTSDIPAIIGRNPIKPPVRPLTLPFVSLNAPPIPFSPMDALTFDDVSSATAGIVCIDLFIDDTSLLT